jgi:hypothetical protein
MITRLCAFDFDSTLISSPMPETGKIEWEKYYNKPFPYKGWWGRPESLDLNVFDVRTFPKVQNILNKDVSTPDTYTIVLTSRQEKLRPLLQKILDVNNIHVDKLDMKRDERTKGQKILDYIKTFPELIEINVYEDKEDEINSYKEIKNQIPENIKFNIYVANQGRLTSIINEEIERLLNNIIKF